jgi:hypothetical protein
LKCEPQTLASDLAEALGATSGKAADTFDTPPISLDRLTSPISQLRTQIGKLDPRQWTPQGEVELLWTEMEAAATKADVGL